MVCKINPLSKEELKNYLYKLKLIDLDDIKPILSIENINLKTNRLAKKQLTWFKQEDRIKIVDTDDEKVIRKEMEMIIDGK